jgi:competence protein ComEC
MSLLLWKIDPQYKVNKTQVLFNGASQGLEEFKNLFNAVKSSQIYPSFDKNYKYSIFFYDTSETFIKGLHTAAPKILPNYLSKDKVKKKSAIASLLPFILLLIIAFIGYSIYDKVINHEYIQIVETDVEFVDSQQETDSPEKISASEKEIRSKKIKPAEQVEEVPAPASSLPPERPVPVRPTTQNLLEVHFIDVGQGDCILIKTSANRYYMIDAGGRKNYRQVDNYLKKLRVNTIETLVLTHPHEDHIGGAVQLLNDYNVKNVIEAGVPYTTVTYRNILDIIKRKKINYLLAKTGMRLRWHGLSSVQILHPDHIEATQNVNNSSVVLRIQHHNVSFLFTGDAESEAEEIILKNNRNIRSTVLKIGHHGSKTSSSEAFINAVKPSYAVIQVGSRNRYGHPHQRTLNLYRRKNVKVYQTDNNGDIVFISDGRTVRLQE